MSARSVKLPQLLIMMMEYSVNLKFNNQGIGKKGNEMALVWHEKASRTALQTSTVNFTHTLLVQTHNMITVKEIAEQCCQL